MVTKLNFHYHNQQRCSKLIMTNKLISINTINIKEFTKKKHEYILESMLSIY